MSKPKAPEKLDCTIEYLPSGAFRFRFPEVIPGASPEENLHYIHQQIISERDESNDIGMARFADFFCSLARISDGIRKIRDSVDFSTKDYFHSWQDAFQNLICQILPIGQARSVREIISDLKHLERHLSLEVTAGKRRDARRLRILRENANILRGNYLSSIKSFEEGLEVLNFIESIPNPQYREIACLYLLEGQTVTEISRKTGRPDATVHRIIFRHLKIKWEK